MMKIFQFQLDLKKPFTTGSGSFKHRNGLLLYVEENGICFWSEASPLPGFSKESFEDVKNNIIQKRNLIGHFLRSEFSMAELDDFSEHFTGLPSLQFAVSYLGLSILAYRKRCCIADLFNLPFQQQVQVNDVIGHQPVTELKRSIRESIQQGFFCIKIKALYPLENLTETVSEIHRENKGVRFRLDANQSWPPDKISTISKMLSGLPIEYIEEPFPWKKQTRFTAELKRLPYPVALDESIQNESSFKSALKNEDLRILIFKPGLMGNLCKWPGTIEWHRSKYKNIVVTASLESIIGRCATAEIAGIIGGENTSHGLNTGKFFIDDLLPVREIKSGKIHLPLVDLKTTMPKHLSSKNIFLVE